MKAQTKQIKFNTVEIREFPIVLSNNPACEYGPSIEIGWEYTDINTADNAIRVSQYEKERFGKRRHEKKGRPSKLYLSQVRREAILKEAGYTDKEVKRAVREKSKARLKRSVSTFLSVGTRINATIKGRRKERKVMRAVRNYRTIGRGSHRVICSVIMLQYTKAGGFPSQLISSKSYHL
uniref:Uncharacterized protein n=1 Tax=Skeletonema marinoi TaxID=267567 RepID=A0A7S2PCG5_9STRA|mmetsp:Transcript_17837/g.30161  ORF Transcript_17837/g.30161 Transcript_17837/m.30161 type:complete len:179 (+) Transcript_17837:80-616(+)